MKFYKRDPDAALAGMADLTLQERGAYNTIIDLLYSRDGALPDDDDMMRRVMGCHGNEWRVVKAKLAAKRKLWIEGGYIKANRVDSVLKEAGNFSETQRIRAGKRWERHGKQSENSEKNKELQLPDNAIPRNTNTPIATPTPKAVVLPTFEENIRKVDRLGTALGTNLTTARNGPKFIEELVRLQADGFDFELDILATINDRRQGGTIPRDLGSLAYFRKAFEAKRTARLVMVAIVEQRATEPVEDTDLRGWQKRLDQWLDGGYWPPRFGPRPYGDGCRAPAALVGVAKLAWEAQGGHPAGAFPADANGRFLPWKDLRDLRENPDVDYGNRALNVVAIPRRA